MTTEGFVKLPRTMLEWQWLDDGNTLRVYIVLLLLANWRDCEWHGIKLKRGQLITGREQLAAKCNLSVQSVRTALNHLISTNEITINSNRQFSIITINNYDFEEKGNQQINQPPTNDQPRANQQSTTIEEVKEQKETKEKEEAAAPLSSPLLNENSFERMPNANPVSREFLVEKYGEENVRAYEEKFDRWAAKRGISNANKYGSVAKWLAEDCVQKPRQSSFGMDEVMSRILARYKS